MTGPEHYREAEEAVRCAQRAGADRPEEERIHLAYAQVHATLALAAAAAMPSVLDESNEDIDGVADWARAITPEGREP
ncbi:hypothetical protein ABZ215_13805 [Amycolatopsis sp. NPDC006131]|uniref:hypothetical protein n=1 Tax=Amycolatopsis sp. NPDC006131 TaxID=3156731 RepID=UPI0033B6BD2C